MAADLPPERGDGQARDAVLINPVCNAIKFTDAGEVVIKAAATTVRSICRYVTPGPASPLPTSRSLVTQGVGLPLPFQ